MDGWNTFSFPFWIAYLKGRTAAVSFRFRVPDVFFSKAAIQTDLSGGLLNPPMDLDSSKVEGSFTGVKNGWNHDMVFVLPSRKMSNYLGNP